MASSTSKSKVSKEAAKQVRKRHKKATAIKSDIQQDAMKRIERQLEAMKIKESVEPVRESIEPVEERGRPLERMKGRSRAYRRSAAPSPPRRKRHKKRMRCRSQKEMENVHDSPAGAANKENEDNSAGCSTNAAES